MDQYHKDEIRKSARERALKAHDELEYGFNFMSKYPRSVTFFGSARFGEDNPHYKQAVDLAKMVVEILGYAVVTGGGGGVMEAGNKGARVGGGQSVAIAIKLPNEQKVNKYATDIANFYYFFTRKVILNFSAEAYIFFPGGYGTLDELFGILTLVQTRKVPPTPIILVGVDFWKPLDEFIKKTILGVHRAISENDLNFYLITDDLEEAVWIIKNAPLRRE